MAFASTHENTNYARLNRLLVDVGHTVLRDIFDSKHPPANLHRVLALWRENYLLVFEFIPRVLKQARQKTRLYCAGCFVEKTEKARASCVQFAATDVKRKFSGNRT